MPLNLVLPPLQRALDDDRRHPVVQVVKTSAPNPFKASTSGWIGRRTICSSPESTDDPGDQAGRPHEEVHRGPRILDVDHLIWHGGSVRRRSPPSNRRSGPRPRTAGPLSWRPGNRRRAEGDESSISPPRGWRWSPPGWYAICWPGSAQSPESDFSLTMIIDTRNLLHGKS